VTLDDIRAACVAAGLPGAEVVPMPPIFQSHGVPLQRWRVCVLSHVAYFYADGNAWFGATATHRATLQRMLSMVNAERASRAEQLAEVDRVLGRKPPTLSPLEAERAR